MVNLFGVKLVRIIIYVVYFMGIVGYVSNFFYCEIKWRRVKFVKKKLRVK